MEVEFDNEADPLRQQIHDLNNKLAEEGVKREEEPNKLEAYMPRAATALLALLAVGLLIWRKDDPKAAKWLFATLGCILGYWLRGGT
jgi:hypothetical protein